ncbi:hypothetical protein ACWGJB_30450 [Streptomyces sp. NPDC054813]
MTRLYPRAARRPLRGFRAVHLTATAMVLAVAAAAVVGAFCLLRHRAR